VEAERPDLRPGPPATSRVAEPAGIAAVFAAAGLPAPDVRTETYRQPVRPEEFWTVALGSGHRLPVDVMGPEAAGRVRAAVEARLARESVTELTCDVLHAGARRPG
jgi:hypothetical protein